MHSPHFTVAVAQSIPVAGDVARNVASHVHTARVASKHHARLVVFPELSLTGYEPSHASRCALEPDDAVLRPLQQAANDGDLTILAGGPIRSEESRPYIGTLVFRPHQEVQLYRKRFLHTGEEQHFVPGSEVGICEADGQRVGIAICADISHEAHPRDVAEQCVQVYAAGVAMTPNGIDDAQTRMSEYSRRYKFLGVMANYGADTGGFEMAGQSAAWDEGGEMLAEAGSKGESLVLIDATPQGWRGRVIEISCTSET